MEERVMQFRVGVMVVAILIITAILVVLFGELPTLVRGAYTIHIRFPQAPGVTKDTPVRKSGVLIGRVSDVQLLDEGGVIVTAKIDSHRKLFHHEVCRINSSLLGDASLEFFFTGEGASRPVEEGDVLTGRAAPDPLQVINQMQEKLSVAVTSVAQTSDELGEVIRRVGSLLDRNEQRITSILAQADESLAVIRTTMENANAVIGDPKVQSQVRRILEDAPQLVADAREAVGQMRTGFHSLDRNLQNLEQFTRPLGEHGTQLVERLDRAVFSIDRMAGDVGAFTQSLNSPNGTLGQLLNNPELYDRLNRTAMRLEELTVELRPIVRDARVFTDKIARHPETLGVRGALERRPGIK